MNLLAFRTCAYVFTLSLICCYTYVDATFGNALVVDMYIIYCSFLFQLAGFRKQRFKEHTWKLYSRMDCTLLVLLNFHR
jgi:hypothetical protein